MATSKIDYDNYLRYGHVEILDTAGGKVYDFDGLDFKFKITRTLDSFSAGFVEASVLNISKDDRDALTEIRDMQTAIERQYRLRIFAGYENSATPFKGAMIADCELCEAMPISPPPDIWMRFKGVYGYMFQFVNVSASLNSKNVTFRELCSKMVDEVLNKYDTVCHTILDFRASDETANKKVTGKDGAGISYDGSLYGIANYLSEIGDVCCFFDMATTVAPGYRYLGARNLVVLDRPSTKTASNKRNGTTYTKIVDEAHGMVGLPQFKPPCEVTCTTLLDPQLRVWDKIDLKSKLIRGIDGKYTIKNLTLEGHLRGQEWYSRIVAYDQGRCPTR